MTCSTGSLLADRAGRRQRDQRRVHAEPRAAAAPWVLAASSRPAPAGRGVGAAGVDEHRAQRIQATALAGDQHGRRRGAARGEASGADRLAGASHTSSPTSGLPLGLIPAGHAGGAKSAAAGRRRPEFAHVRGRGHPARAEEGLRLGLRRSGRQSPCSAPAGRTSRSGSAPPGRRSPSRGCRSPRTPAPCRCARRRRRRCGSSWSARTSRVPGGAVDDLDERLGGVCLGEQLAQLGGRHAARGASRSSWPARPGRAERGGPGTGRRGRSRAAASCSSISGVCRWPATL